LFMSFVKLIRWRDSVAFLSIGRTKEYSPWIGSRLHSSVNCGDSGHLVILSIDCSAAVSNNRLKPGKKNHIS
jgi:hypothetical protein